MRTAGSQEEEEEEEEEEERASEGAVRVGVSVAAKRATVAGSDRTDLPGPLLMVVMVVVMAMVMVVVMVMIVGMALHQH